MQIFFFIRHANNSSVTAKEDNRNFLLFDCQAKENCLFLQEYYKFWESIESLVIKEWSHHQNKILQLEGEVNELVINSGDHKILCGWTTNDLKLARCSHLFDDTTERVESWFINRWFMILLWDHHERGHEHVVDVLPRNLWVNTQGNLHKTITIKSRDNQTSMIINRRWAVG